MTYSSSMRGKILIIVAILVPLLIIGYVAYDFLVLDTNINPENNILSPLAKKAEKLTETFDDKPDTDLADKGLINILLLGIDRRSKFENSYRTDIMILLTIDKENNRAVLTSVPRDLWYDGGRLNATYIQNGWEGIQQAFTEISGYTPDRFILTDFEDFSWIVDAMGGIPVDVEISFTDSSYPVDATKEYQTVSFTKGQEVMTGERALIFSRSRKGDFDNGDWGRMKRQHLLLKGMLEAITQKESFLCKIDNGGKTPTESCANKKISKDTLMKALTMVTENRMDTNLEIEDLSYVWDFYSERESYVIESIFMDYDYLYSPPLSEYGGAWVLAPVGGSYADFQADLRAKINGTFVEDPTEDQLPQSAEIDTAF